MSLHTETTARRAVARSRVASYALWLVAAAALGVAGVLLAPLLLPAERDLAEIASAPPANPKKVTAYQGEINGLDKNNQPFSIKAARGSENSLSSETVRLEQVNGSFQGSEGKPLDVASARGQYDTKSKVLVLDGDVVIKDNKGMTAKMDKARFNTDTKSLVSQAPVNVTLSNGTVAADTLTADNNGDRLVFKGRVKAKFGASQ